MPSAKNGSHFWEDIGVIAGLYFLMFVFSHLAAEVNSFYATFVGGFFVLLVHRLLADKLMKNPLGLFFLLVSIITLGANLYGIMTILPK